MLLIVPLLLGGILLFGCTPTVKKVVLHRSGEDVVVVKRSSFKLTPEERSFVTKEARKFGMEVPERREIERFIRFYLRDRRGLKIALRRASLYVPHIKPILKEYGLPEELALLPLIESGFNPFAVSPSGAAGIWQLMPQTARRFGLRVDSKVDERFDLTKSTHAAARYLKELYEMFGSWELVLAAYNCGEGCVRRRTGSKDFWRTKWALPEQTRKYVPMFFAALLIARSPEKYGLRVDGDLHLFERRVAVRDYKVNEFLREAGIKESTFRDLNPHIKGNYIPAGVFVYVPKMRRTVVIKEPPRVSKRVKGGRVKVKGSSRKVTVVKRIPESAPRLVIRSEKGEEIRILERRTKVITLENGALLYIKE